MIRKAREPLDVALVSAWMSASREDKRLLLMVMEACRESERVAENLWTVSPVELSHTEDAPPIVGVIAAGPPGASI